MSEQNVLSISNALAISKMETRCFKIFMERLEWSHDYLKKSMPIYLLAGRFANTTFNSGRVEVEVREVQIS